MQEVTVLYFAAARERAGTSSERVRIPAGTTVEGLIETLIQRHPELRSVRGIMRIAVNQDFADGDAPVPADAEVALIPPVAGGSGTFRVVDRPLSLDEVVKAVEAAGVGGIVTFTGCVRNETKGRRVLRLVYEAYAPMAERKMEEIARDAAEKWPGSRLAIVHRIGVLEPGELAVVIAASAPHRDAAFQACRHAIERLKKDVPIWKKEHFEDGEVWVGLGP
ncbi:MAG TPA: molybdopterin converting factor subunit 1 [Myxococcaceae bacterium]|nr:molybdopterin converting factor subunit 1 [Myxococcaceae bacterium]